MLGHIILYVSIVLFVWYVSGPFWILCTVLRGFFKNPGEATLRGGKLSDREAEDVVDELDRDWLFHVCIWPFDKSMDALEWLGLRKRTGGK